jgi:hypothetical protein
VAEVPNLVTLYVSRTDISDAGLRSLQRLKNLEYLDLTETRIDGRGLAALASLRIRTLCLSQTLLDPQSLRALADFPDLRSLDLSETWLTDGDLPLLDGVRGLVYLNLMRTAVTAEAIDRLRRERVGCRIERRENPVFEPWQPIRPGGAPATD